MENGTFSVSGATVLGPKLVSLSGASATAAINAAHLPAQTVTGINLFCASCPSFWIYCCFLKHWRLNGILCLRLGVAQPGSQNIVHDRGRVVQSTITKPQVTFFPVDLILMFVVQVDVTEKNNTCYDCCVWTRTFMHQQV